MSVKYILGGILRFSAIPLIVRNTYGRKKVSIIVYHDPEKHVFKKHIRYLSKLYNFISLDDLVNAIKSKEWAALPPKSLVITFDDGVRGNYDLLDVFEEHNLKPTIFICTKIVNSNRKFWFNNEGIEVEKLKKLTNSERNSILHKKIGFNEKDEFNSDERQALSLDEINHMFSIVDFQSHTSFHPILIKCSESESWNEIYNSKIELESLTGVSCKHFAYPNGDYSKREIEFVKKAGYSSARTIKVGWNDVNTNPYELKTVGVADDASINWLSAQMCGLLHLIRDYFMPIKYKILRPDKEPLRTQKDQGSCTE